MSPVVSAARGVQHRRRSSRSGRSAGARAVGPWPGERPDRGSVTAEIAVALPALVVLLLAALTAVSAVTAQMRCVDAARETARTAARGEVDAVAMGVRVAPVGATVTLDGNTETVRAVVTVRVRAMGPWPFAPIVRATAVAAREAVVEQVAAADRVGAP